MRRASLSALLFAATACAHVHGGQSTRLETVNVGNAVVRVQYGLEDAETAEQVKGALRRAVAAAERWGRLSTPVLVTIHPTHRALEVATHHEGYGWMRAWARYASVDLQSPRTWPDAKDGEVERLLAHELTHCVMYQSVASEWSWRRRLIPLWFREGMASVTAGQEQGRVQPEAIGRFYRDQTAGEGARPAGDPLTDPGPLYRSSSDLVYGTAHRAFHFLLDRYGEERVRRLIANMGDGDGFREAFWKAMGIPVEDFEGDFRRYAVSHSARTAEDANGAPETILAVATRAPLEHSTR